MKAIKKKKCEVCKKEFTPFQITPVCSYICALKFNEQKEVNKRVKEMKVSSQKISELEGIARKIFQQWIRLRDEHQPCISCGKTSSTQWDGSHYYKAEIWSGLIFDETNVHKSCSYCNKELHGNLVEYRKGLIKRYGVKYVEDLESVSDAKRQHKYTRVELMEIIDKYKSKIKYGQYE